MSKEFKGVLNDWYRVGYGFSHSGYGLGYTLVGNLNGKHEATRAVLNVNEEGYAETMDAIYKLGDKNERK